MSVEEDLREFYITKTFLQRLKHRASFWEKESIQFQITQFQKKLGDYPELCEILETVLHTRSLNEFHKKTKKLSNQELKQIKPKYKNEKDFLEVLNIELEIRSGTRKLKQDQKVDTKTHIV